MSKYIDADLLREKIAEQMESLPREVGRGAGTITSKGYGMMEAFQIMRSIIDSLQQEQPEVDLEKEYKTWWNSISSKINVEHIMEWYMHETAHHFYELGFGAREDVPKIKGWVARDEDGTLHFFSSECGDGEPLYYEDSGTWYTVTGDMLEIVHPNGAFGKLSFIDEPVEVELTIRKV